MEKISIFDFQSKIITVMNKYIGMIATYLAMTLWVFIMNHTFKMGVNNVLYILLPVIVTLIHYFQFVRPKEM